MTAPDSILQLVQRFNDHRASYLAGKYNEAQLRRDFLDPFFVALGWDVFNQKNYSERYREVIDEISVEVEGGAKAADYAFRVGEKTVFFVEAKKPSVNIETNPEPAFQLRRYGWSAHLQTFQKPPGVSGRCGADPAGDGGRNPPAYHSQPAHPAADRHPDP